MGIKRYFTEHRHILNLILLFLNFAIVSMNIDILVPAIKDITRDLSLTVEGQYSINSLYLVSLSVSVLISGPISDRFGKHLILLLGASAYLLGSLIGYMSFNKEAFFLSRLIQGLGGGLTLVVSISYIFDYYREIRAIQITNYLNIFVITLLALAPVIGSYINLLVGWKCIFLLTALCSLFFVLSLLIGGKRGDSNLKYSVLKTVISSHRNLISNKVYLLYSFATALQYSFIILYICNIDLLYDSTVFIVLSPVNVQLLFMVVFMAFSFANSFLIERFSQNVLIKSGFTLAFIGFGFVLVTKYMGPYISSFSALLSSAFVIAGVALNLNILVARRIKMFPGLESTSYSLGLFMRYVICAVLLDCSYAFYVFGFLDIYVFSLPVVPIFAFYLFSLKSESKQEEGNLFEPSI